MSSLYGRIGPPIILTIRSRIVVNNYWAHSPVSSKHVVFCMFVSLIHALTTHHSNIVVWLKKVTVKGLHIKLDNENQTMQWDCISVVTPWWRLQSLEFIGMFSWKPLDHGSWEFLKFSLVACVRSSCFRVYFR